MKQWITHQDGFANLKLVDAEEPKPEDLKDGEVIVKINRVCLNYRDTEVIMGLYTHHKTLHAGNVPPALVPCSDMSGTILHTTPSSPFQVGQTVLSTFNQTHTTGQVQAHHLSHGLGLPLPGVLTSTRIFPSTGLVLSPSHLTPSEASTLPIASVTAWMSLNSFQPFFQPLSSSSSSSSDGDQEDKKYVLLQGTGGVSTAAAQISKKLGLTVIQTSSSDAKLLRCKEELGIDHGINYRSQPDWSEEVLRLTGGKGADVILECGGAETLAQSFNCVAFGGIIACIGYLSGKGVTEGDSLSNVNVMALKRNVTLKGILNGPRDRFEEMLELVYNEKKNGEDKSTIRPVVDREFEFDEAKEAFEYLFSGSHFGKVVIKVP